MSINIDLEACNSCKYIYTHKQSSLQGHIKVIYDDDRLVALWQSYLHLLFTRGLIEIDG